MSISKTSLLTEAISRTQNKVRPTPILLREDFPKQNAFINDTSKYISVQCSRRSGKTTGLAIRFLRTMEKHPKTTCLYLSLTQESARAIMWDILHDLNDTFKIGCTFLES